MNKKLTDDQCRKKLEKYWDGKYSHLTGVVGFYCDVSNDDTYSWVYDDDGERKAIVISRETHIITEE